LLDEHLDRLFHSADKIALKPNLSRPEMKAIILATLQAADRKNALVRVFLSRGPGNFSVNPYDTVGAQFYVVVTELKAPDTKKYEHGVSLGRSTIPCKDPWMAQIKSCNYLHNVLMKKEAVDRQIDYALGIDAEGNISEGCTENIMILDQSGSIAYPKLNGILKGITMTRACELAREHGMTVVERSISLAELIAAPEVMITGTSLDVLPVSSFENQPITLGPVAKKLRELIQADIHSGPSRTEF
jgi:branched-chain amino acid aminotransferase